MIQPPYLIEGDQVQIVSTARKISRSEVEAAINILSSWGLKVVLGKNLFSSENQFAGSDSERLSDFQNALDKENTRAIFCARGGYGTVRILDDLSFESFKSNPKWVVGYSDVTFLHAHLQEVIGSESLHASMPINFSENTPESLELLRISLFGCNLAYKIDGNLNNIEGDGNGKLIGGNLSILYALNGSKSMPNSDGCILFIEDLDEYLYHMDRMMMNLKRSGFLEKLNGLVVGGMTDMNDNQIPFGKTTTEIILDVVKEYDFPVCFDFPAGHIKNNCPLIMGRNVDLKVEKSGVKLDFH